MRPPPPSTPQTPAPRRFLPAKKDTITSGKPPSSQTPAIHSQFQFRSTPRFGSSSVPRPTQARGYDLEDVDEVEEDEDDIDIDDDTRRDGEVVGREACVLQDSIEAASDGVTSTLDDVTPSDAMLSFKGVMDDDIEPNSFDPTDAPWSPNSDSDPELDQRTAKKRKMLSISPASESGPTERKRERELEREWETGSDTDSGVRIGGDGRGSQGYDRDGNSPSNRAGGRSAHEQPVFQTAPRFKPSEADQDLADGIPAAFSPPRRGTRYLPGGLAAELQAWLSEVKGWKGFDDDGGYDRQACDSITIDELRPGRRMYLARGRVAPEGPARGFILAGEGKLTGLERRARLEVGNVVALGQPVWEVRLEEEVWTVACAWNVVS
ncbi:hypothetical protein RJ55_01122 [Drechmeria coniospora]|nr:hypothetical protein RJ55_01122 [Drechmeria coniospora]